eukprot:TRINITY_DN5330_c0_g1_i2.p1 TRINITY_DN5330_c0_g1~~TRINITY_DN5330_c0_g1_i2.p1  ORF type:complete len:366 (+),score=54.33 TRINITY_DN5330_c0_g1_i2:72-1100(+)
MAPVEECRSRSLETSTSGLRASDDHAGDKIVKASTSAPKSSPCKDLKTPASDSVATRKQMSAIPTPSRRNTQRQRPPGSPGEVVMASSMNSSTKPQQRQPSSPREVVKTSPVHSCTKPPPPEPVASPLRTARRPGTPFPVWLHVYDLGHISKYLVNSWALNSRDSSCLGIFHVGVEVLNVEFSFQAMADCGDDDDITGLTWHNPKSHPRHVYRESVCLGNSALNAYQVGKLLEKLEKEWPARKYHCLTKNCVDFAEHFTRLVGAPLPFPKWTHGLAKNLASRDLVPPPPACRLLPCSWSSSSNSQSMGSLGSFGRKVEDNEETSKSSEALRQAQSCSLFGIM